MDIVIAVLIALILIVLTDDDFRGTPPKRQRKPENGAGAPQGAVLNFA